MTKELIMLRLNYCQISGVFTRKSGKVAGTVNSKGYIKIEISGKKQPAHRLAWFLTHGVFPAQLDHVNGIKTDNRIANLRECSTAQNNANIGTRKDNSTGFRGVFRDGKRWRAAISINGKWTNVGAYATPELASAAYEARCAELRGEFYRAEK